MSDEIVFQAEMKKVQTMADGGIRFVFDTGEKFIKEAAMLMDCKRQGLYLNVVITQHETQEEIALNEERAEGLG